MVDTRKRARTSSKKKEKVRRDVAQDTEDADVVFEEAGEDRVDADADEEEVEEEDNETAAQKRLRLGTLCLILCLLYVALRCKLRSDAHARASAQI